MNGARLEKNDNLNMALAVRRILQAQGHRVVMTRSTDVYIPLAE
ncbi:MAG: N-acetylmuramoyl-L-alanine amidase, partial [Clostridiales bacterium]|nr:N-acetylmuramoyl-L-alanine amidase [Clostridiales bacterium]